MLNAMQKDKEELEEVSTELELADEDELVPYAFTFFFFFPSTGGMIDVLTAK